MDEILPRLYLGNLEDAKSFTGGEIITVYETLWPEEPRTSIWIPILMDQKAKMQQLDLATEKIAQIMKSGQKLLVHCHDGMHRSPLLLAYFLTKTFRNFTIEDAYKFIKEKRPIVEERLEWLE